MTIQKLAKKQKDDARRKAYLKHENRKTNQLKKEAFEKKAKDKAQQKKEKNIQNRKATASIIKDEKNIAEKSLNHLLSLSKMYSEINTDLSQFYLWQYNKLAKNNMIDIGASKSDFCSHCYSPSVPGKTSTVTNIQASTLSKDHSKQNYLVDASKLDNVNVYECNVCNYQTIFKGINNKKRVAQKTKKHKVVHNHVHTQNNNHSHVKAPNNDGGIIDAKKNKKAKANQKNAPKKEDTSVMAFLNMLDI
ncbi:ribonuclease P protein component 4 [Acrasis kona]|uniref:Ribonuclease P protein component 4 n=1 Tax=Acrasis kona TaxID=1008807 RepID=A0AAW2YXG7_9EUKA